MSSYGEYAVVAFNMVKACIGAGIYGYPNVYNENGLFVTTFMTVLSAIASAMGTHIYLNLNQKYGRNNTISSLGSTIVSKNFKYFADCVVILKSLAVGAGYLNQARRIILSTLSETKTNFFNKDIQGLDLLIASLGCGIVAPVVLSKSLGKFKYISYAGTFCIFLLILFSRIETTGMAMNYEVFVKDTKIFENLGTWVFGFSCHQSILAIQNESPFGEKTLKYISTVSFTLVSILYLSFGLINYLAFSISDRTGMKVNLREIFDAWNQNHFTTKAAKILFAFNLIASMPFQLHAAKSYFLAIFPIKNKMESSVGISMIILCCLLTTVSWYDFGFVANYVTKILNSLLCFGFPVLYRLLDDSPKTKIDLIICSYLVFFTFLCILTYFTKII